MIPGRFVTAWHIRSTPCRCEIPPIVNTPISDYPSLALSFGKFRMDGEDGASYVEAMNHV